MSGVKPAAAPSAADTSVKFRLPGSPVWEVYEDAAKDKDGDTTAAAARERLSSYLTSSLQMQNLLVLAGSGTSFGVGGPKMEELWALCVGATPSDATGKVLKALSYGAAKGEQDIEELLSRCDAFLSFNTDADVEAFRNEAVTKILARCREAANTPTHDLGPHKEFLRRLARRRARDTRLRLFTTNYDLSFEKAAGELGLVAIDGFSFSQPRRFDPRFFEYDIVHRGAASGDASSLSFVSGVFHYFKLHGSVDWESTEDESTRINPDVKASSACLTYPARTKYQRSFQQPHLELMAQYLASLRQANTCLVITGFGFNDAHLSEPVLASLETNPHFRLFIVARSAEKKLEDPKAGAFWTRLAALSKHGADVGFLLGTFEQLVQRMPDLQALSPAERLYGTMKELAKK